MFLKIGDELFNLDNVARIELNLAQRKPIPAKESGKVRFYFAVPEINMGAEAISQLEPFVFEDAKDVAALRWFFGGGHAFCAVDYFQVDLLKEYAKRMEIDRRKRKEFQVGDEVWYVNDEHTWLIKAIDGDCFILRRPSDDDEGDDEEIKADRAEVSFSDN